MIGFTLEHFELSLYDTDNFICSSLSLCLRGCHGHDRMVVGFTTTYVISAYHY